jgi:predicted HicB family RNase H-like nuclease
LGEDAKSVVFTLRLTETERDALVETAEREGKPVTAWARETLIEATITRP